MLWCRFYINCSVVFLSLFVTVLEAQVLGEQSEVAINVKTTGKLMRKNRLIMVVEVDVPSTWKLNVKEGYGSIGNNELDTLSMSLRFKNNSAIQLIQRLKAERKPSDKGYFYKKIIFAQTIAFETASLPIKINADLKWLIVNAKHSKHSRGVVCCLLKVAAKREDIETINVGWICNKRATLYLEDVLAK